MISTRIVFVLGVIAVGLWQAMNSMFTVRPESEAVVLRFGNVQRVEGPGLHFRLPFVERVLTYPKLNDRQQVLKGPFEVASCPAEVALVYEIDDVVAFHESGADYAAILALTSLVSDALTKVPDNSETPAVEAQKRMIEALKDERPAGLRVIHASVDLGDCGPQPPRVEIRREPLRPIASVGEFGRERIPLFSDLLRTADGERVEINQAVVTYDVIEPERFKECFRNPETAGPRIADIVATYLRRLVGDQTLKSLADVAGRVPDLTLELQAGCGVAVQAVDYSSATLTRLVSINCSEVPNSQKCGVVDDLKR